MTRTAVRLILSVTLLVFLGLLAVPSSVTAPGAAVVAPEALPEDLRDLRIEEAYIPTSFKMAGVIHSVDGKVLVIHRSNQEAYLGSEGDPIHENDEFYTLPDTRCRLRFTNEDVVSLAPETRFSLDEYSTQEEKQEKSSLFSMVKGKAMFYAMRLFRFKKVRFQVKTPTAVMGVRGTKFGAHVYYIDEKSADSQEVRVADSGRSLGPYLAQAGNGGTPVTVAACGDGSVDVNGNELGPGDYYNSYTGEVGNDPTVLGNIEQSTGGTGGTGGDEGGGDDDGGGDGDGGDLNDTLSNITNTEGGENTLGGEEGGGDVQLTQYGYFAALLNYNDGTTDLEDVFLSKTPNTFGVGQEHRADSILDGDYLIWEGSYTFVTTDNGTGNNISVTTTAEQLSSGYNYLAYGKWSHTGTFTGSGTFAFVNYSWWIEGLGTPESAIATQTGSLQYSGEAYGTMTYGGTSHQLSGAFTTTANFDTSNIENFGLAVSDGGTKTASIAGAGGVIDPDGTFDLTGGTWTLSNGIDTVSPSEQAAYGRFFGPNAEEIGGDWAMKGYFMTTGEYVGAAGIFGGKQTQP